ncbi:MAG: ABC transporter permease subunit [Acholeplasmataceae bacterium]|jgi:ABC-type uncharacterized transport system permease subunit
MKSKKVSFFSKPAVKSISSSLLAIFLGLLIGFIIMIVSNPRSAIPGIGRMFIGPFNNPAGPMRGIGQLLYRATPYIFTGLAVAFAFKTGLFNIGASGQYMMGIFVAMLIAFKGEALGWAQWPIAVLAGALAGAIWGSISGALKALLNVNEVITCIMLNYTALYVMNGLLKNYFMGDVINPAQNRSFPIPENARNSYFFLDKIFPNSGVDIGIFIAIIVVLITFFILKKTKFGKELIAVGSNRYASRYAGINEKKSMILSMAIAGLFAGLGGALFILAPSVRNLGNNYAVENNISPVGFDAIPVALLANSHPIGVFVSALFIQHIKIGGQYMQSVGFKPEIVDVIIGVILYFSAFALIIGRYVTKLFRRKKAKNDDKQELELIDYDAQNQEVPMTSERLEAEYLLEYEKVQIDVRNVQIIYGEDSSNQNVLSNLTLLESGESGTIITWHSNYEKILTSNGVLKRIKQKRQKNQDEHFSVVELAATVSSSKYPDRFNASVVIPVIVYAKDAKTYELEREVDLSLKYNFNEYTPEEVYGFAKEDFELSQAALIEDDKSPKEILATGGDLE